MTRAYANPGIIDCSKLKSSMQSEPWHPRHEFQHLVHLSNQSVDLVFTVTGVSPLDEVLEFPSVKAASRVAQLKRPEEVTGLLEVGTNGIDLMDQVFHADDSILAKLVFNDRVVRQGNTLLVDLAIATLVDELTNALEIRIAVRDVGLNDGQHLRGSGCQANECSAIDLEETEELEDLAGFRGDLVYTGRC